MNRPIRTILVSLLLTLPSFAADSMNVAIYGIPFVYYKGSKPLSIDGINPDTTRMNPATLNDLSYFTYVDFPPSPVSNIGSWFGISLQRPEIVSSIAIHQFLNNYVTYRTRVRKVAVWGSLDSVQWTLLATVVNTDTAHPMFMIPIIPAQSIRLVRVELLAMDAIQSSVVSEFKVFASNDSVYHRIVSVLAAPQSFQNGGSSSLITWTSENHPTTAKVNILFKATGTQQFTMLAENELNDGSYLMNTTGLPDGDGTIRIEPVTEDYSIGSQATLSVKNYNLSNVSLNNAVNNGYPPFHSAYGHDSIHLTWSCTPNVMRGYHFRVILSADSGKTWVRGPLLPDSSVRNTTWEVPSDQQLGLYCFLGIETVVDSAIVARNVYPYPLILVGKLPYPVLWSKRSNDLLSDTKMSIASVRLHQGKTPAVFLGSKLAVDPSTGDTVFSTNSLPFIGTLAVADINGDASYEIVSTYVTTENGSVLFFDTLSAYGYDPQVTDCTNDGIPEIISVLANNIYIRSNTGVLLKKITLPSTLGGFQLSPVIANIDNTPEPEFIIGMLGSNQVYAFRLSGVSVPGFPVTVSDLLQSQPMVADLDNDGVVEIIVLGETTLWCLDPQGNVKSGFPVSVSEKVIRQYMSIADIDGDNYLDMVISSSRPAAFTGLATATINCIDYHGKSLPGWPTTIRDGYVHYDFDSFTNFVSKTIYNGMLSAPYIVSLDGDAYNEIVFFSTSGFMYVFDRSGVLQSSRTVFIGPFVNGTPDFSDIDGDGRLNAYLTVSSHRKLNTLALDFGPGSYNPKRMPWPTYRQNIARTAIPPQPIPLAVEEEPAAVMRTFALEQNYPNPFNPSTTIAFSVPESGPVRLTVHDVLGREVHRIVDERLAQGRYTRAFTADGLNSGVYFYTLSHGTRRETKRLTIIK